MFGASEQPSNPFLGSYSFKIDSQIKAVEAALSSPFSMIFLIPAKYPVFTGLKTPARFR
jgi:hypothetical protein